MIPRITKLGAIIIFAGLVQYCPCEPDNVQEPARLNVSNTAVGVLTFADGQDLQQHLQAVNSVEIPDSHLSKPQHELAKRQSQSQSAAVAADDAGDSLSHTSANTLFGGDSVPKLTNIQADCINPQFIKVSVDFDKPFQGIIYTKGHFNDDNCLFTKEDVPLTSLNFTIPTDMCGILNNHEANSSITEATIIVQNDPLFQDVSDVARRIRCAWSDRFDKIISSRGFKVGGLAENTMDYSADAVSVWMDLRMGKDPFQGSPVTNGVVRLGSDMTIVVYIKSKIEKGLDVVIRDCVANDAKKHQQIQLTDENGCVVQKKLMTPFTITDKVGQSGASRIAYAMLKSFKFPDSLDVNIICNVAMCKGDCGISCSNDKPASPATNRKVMQSPVAKVDSSLATATVTRSKRQADANLTGTIPRSTMSLASVVPVDGDNMPLPSPNPSPSQPAQAQTANVVAVEKMPPSPGISLPPRDIGPMDDMLVGKTVFLKETEPTEVILERGIRVLADNDITEVLMGNQNRSYDILATTVKDTGYICVTRVGFGIGLGILLIIILILTILCVFLCCAACARKRNDTKVVENSSINIYNSTDELNKSRGSLHTASQSHLSGPASILRGSLPNITSYLSNGTDGRLGRNVPQQSHMRASAATLPGLGIATNPMVRHSTQSLTSLNNVVAPDSFLPFPPPPDLDNTDTNTEKARSLRSIAIRNRHHTVAIGVDELNQEEEADPLETARSLRSFTLRSDTGNKLQRQQTEPDEAEAPRSLRSFTAHSTRNQRNLPLTSAVSEAGNGEALRSLRSFTVRSDRSDTSEDTTSVTLDNGEHPRSEGTIRSGSLASLVQGATSEADEQPRSMRSVSVYRN